MASQLPQPIWNAQDQWALCSARQQQPTHSVMLFLWCKIIITVMAYHTRGFPIVTHLHVSMLMLRASELSRVCSKSRIADLQLE